MAIQCIICGSVGHPKTVASRHLWRCPQCLKVSFDGRRKIVATPCLVCKKPVIVQGRYQLRLLHRGYAYCSETCRRAWRTIACRKAMTPAKRKAASIRMKSDNPMRQPGIRQKVSATLKKIQHKPSVQGGNGRGPTVPERALSKALKWPCNVVVPTGMPAGSGYPTCYRLDLANRKLKITIEIDGTSHSAFAQRRRDIRKTEFLESRGWTVVRFKNREVLEHLAECLKKVRMLVTERKQSRP
jgi:hypothetical protein